MLRPMLEQKHHMKAEEEKLVAPGTGHLRTRKTKVAAHSHSELSQTPRPRGKSPTRRHRKGASRNRIHSQKFREQETKPIYLKIDTGKRKEGKAQSLPPAISQSRKNKTLLQEVAGSREERKSRKLGGGDSKMVDLRKQEIKKTIKAVTWRLHQKALEWGQNTSSLDWRSSRGDAPFLHRPIFFPSLRPGEGMAFLPATCHLSESTISCTNVNLKAIPLLSDRSLKTLFLAENEISKIPAETFNGVPNLEWLDLSKNKLETQGLDPDAFKASDPRLPYLDGQWLRGGDGGEGGNDPERRVSP
ncbi:uncharacterized protein LOC141549065 [Sminthopsis crassicaudata]|uniref:uncharacterized protein LOC141549065 n=1 Tax=Sminthopsis crassicaudata TaxID=9301 RepID=UPI003D68DB98